MNISRTSLLGAALLAMALPVGAALAHPPVVAEHVGVRHSYVYYPSHRIYYEPSARTWFWFDNGNWRFGAVLPVFYEQFTTGGVNVVLDAGRPYERQEWVETHYGRPVVIVNRRDAHGHEYRRDYDRGNRGHGRGHDHGHGHGHGNGPDRD